MAISPQDPAPRWRRRDFLLAGASLAFFQSVPHRRPPSSEMRLALGYCPEISKSEVTRPTLIAPESLASGEAELATKGARMTIHGLLGKSAGLIKQGIRSMEIRVGFPTWEADHSKVAFKAWSYDLLPIEQAASANSFTVPIDTSLSLELDLETLGLERFETELVIGDDLGLPKLRPGHYVIAPGARTFDRQSFDDQRTEPLIAFSVEPADRFEASQLS